MTRSQLKEAIRDALDHISFIERSTAEEVKAHYLESEKEDLWLLEMRLEDLTKKRLEATR